MARPKLCWLTTLLFSVSICLSFFPSNLVAQDWPALRGADGRGSTNPGGILAKAQNIDLKVRWKKEIGGGYSSVVLAGDRVVTCCTDGEHDQVVCLDKKTGDQIWSSELGASYKGENGSFDGPITTPLIYENHVYALDPAGALVCLSLEDGIQVWSVDLEKDLESKKPLYGFATSPIVAGGMLILQTGVKDGSLAGMDPKTGEVKWTATNDAINSQTPTAMNFMGREIVLAAGGKNLAGVDPATGDVLFEFEHQGGNGSAVVPVPIEDNGVVLTLDDLFSKAVVLRPGNEDKIEVSELWQNRSIKNTYNVPALCNGNLFAFSTRILTCVDPKTGDAHWKSREPGDGFLITVDGHIIINTKQGTLHVAKASSEGYEEVAWLELFDDLCWSLPAYSDNAIFCRNLKEIACVDIVASEVAGGVGAVDSMPRGFVFSEFLGRARQAGDADARKKVIDEFLESQKSFPIVEGNIVHFVYRGEGNDVAVASDMFGARQEKKMERLGDSDLFYYGMELEPDQRANYVFFVDYKPQRDPLNPRTMTSSMYAGEMEFAVRLRGEKPLEMSWFGMSDWREPDYLKELPQELTGSLTSEKLESEILEGGMSYEVYLPRGYNQDEATRYRTIYVFAPPGGRQLGQFDKAVDNIFDSRMVSPAILVFPQFPPSADGQKAFIEELVPAIDKKYRTIADRSGRTAAGFGFAAGVAIGLATKHNDQFCGCAVYSPLVFNAEQAMIEAAFKELKNPMDYYIDWGRFDMYNPHENWDVRDVSSQLYELCQKTDNVIVKGGQMNDSADWSSWRNRYLEFLKVGAGN